ncbi:MAG: helicase-related protein [Bryobacterales bacterium]|nr:helicase-related protein [Bryobacterales bacterium]
MIRIDLDLARELIDFQGSSRKGIATRRRAITSSFSESQLRGAVASYNMLAENRVAYIADEVGMGKTYVALGVMGLVRHFSPDARMLVIAPRENIQRKWVKELRNFVRNNWQVIDNRVKSIQGRPARQPTVCNSLDDFAHELAVNADRDFFLRMTSFSLALKRAESRRRYRRQMERHLRWIGGWAIRARSERRFRRQYGRALNLLIPEIDLLVVDEAHNLRKGFGSDDGKHVSNRNRILGLALGHPLMIDPKHPQYRPRVKRVLCLSATPFDDDYGDLWQQLDVLCSGDAHVGRAGDGQALPLRVLACPSAGETEKRRVAANLLLRRVTHLTIGNERHTKNMYRREWRHGGFRSFDDPIKFENPRQRLIVALVQKKVAEVLGDERFGNRFQIGMLSSFESFLETVGNIRPESPQAAESAAEQSDSGHIQGTFDGRQTQKRAEQHGADTGVLNALIESYREHFRSEMPHPKLDAAVESLASAFETGEKALVFVRRVATVGELARRLDRQFDKWVRRKMEAALPARCDEIDALFRRFERDTRSDKAAQFSGSTPGPVDVQGGEFISGVDDDPGGRENFFSWFFRGEGPDNVLSGAAFQKNRLSNIGAVYSTFFEDDLIAWILGRPDDPLAHLAAQLCLSPESLESQLRELAWGYFRIRTKRVKGYPRLYVFEAYQSAALHLVAESCAEEAIRAKEVLKGRFPEHTGEHGNAPAGFPQPDLSIGIATFFTELVRHPQLREDLWPREAKGKGATFAERLQRREQRRELLSAMSRLGAAYIDLYLLAIDEAGSFELKRAAGPEATGRDLARKFVTLLAEQRTHSGFHAFAELKSAADAFDTLIGVNFPNIPDAKLSELAEQFGRGLQHQNPVGRMSGRVSERTVQQFRMPGFPLILISTDVLQEGEDLHTFCRSIIHYGITWTPSAMEQRTGRVDRIDSLVQRELDRREQAAEPEEMIQVHYPHLEDTVERLQVKRVLQRLDRSSRLMHETAMRRAHDPRIDKNREILTSMDLPAPVRQPLESAFPVRDEWLKGVNDERTVHKVDVRALTELLDGFWDRLRWDLGIDRLGQQQPLYREGVVPVTAEGAVGLTASHDTDGRRSGAPRQQLVRTELRSAGIDGVTFVRCSSEIGLLDLSQAQTVDQLRRLQLRNGRPRLCARRQTRYRKHALSVEASLPFDLGTTQYEEFREMVSRVAEQADKLEHELLGVDSDPFRPTGEARRG